MPMYHMQWSNITASILIKELLNGEEHLCKKTLLKNKHLYKKVLNKGMLLTDLHKETPYQPLL